MGYEREAQEAAVGVWYVAPPRQIGIRLAVAAMVTATVVALWAVLRMRRRLAT